MSDMYEQIDDAQGLLRALHDPSLSDDSKALQTIDVMEDFKMEILGFFKNRIASISRAEKIKELIFQQLENDIPAGRLNFEQFMTLLMRLARDNNESADSIISMLRNNGGSGGSSLLTDIVRPETAKSDLVKAFENYTPEDLRKVNETVKVIRDIIESGATVAVEASDVKTSITEF